MSEPILFYSEGSYTRLNPDFNDRESHLKARNFLVSLSRLDIYPTQNITLADIGCGGGGFAREISKAGIFGRIVALDPNPEAIRFAEQRLSDDCITYSVGNLFDLRESFDVVTMVHVLEHLWNWPDALAFIKGRCSYLYINVPLEASIWHLLRRGTLTRQYKKYGHVHFFDSDFLVAVLVDNGFEIVEEAWTDEFLSFTSLGARVMKNPRLILGFFSRRLAAKLFGGYCYRVLCKVPNQQ